MLEPHGWFQQLSKINTQSLLFLKIARKRIYNEDFEEVDGAGNALNQEAKNPKDVNIVTSLWTLLILFYAALRIFLGLT